MKESEHITCFQLLRERAAGFCAERDWGKFHLPASIALALAGIHFVKNHVHPLTK